MLLLFNSLRLSLQLPPPPNQQQQIQQNRQRRMCSRYRNALDTDLFSRQLLSLHRLSRAFSPSMSVFDLWSLRRPGLHYPCAFMPICDPFADAMIGHPLLDVRFWVIATQPRINAVCKYNKRRSLWTPLPRKLLAISTYILWKIQPFSQPVILCPKEEACHYLGCSFRRCQESENQPPPRSSHEAAYRFTGIC